MKTKTKIKLTKKQADFLNQLPEQGMGYQVVDIKLNDGTVLRQKLVFNSTYLELDENEFVDPRDIQTIALHKK